MTSSLLIYFYLNYPYFTVAHNCHDKLFLLSKINFATAKSISLSQNQLCHGKINFITTKSISPRQNQFRHGKFYFIMAKPTSQYGKIFFSTAKSFSSTAKYISPPQTNFGKLAQVTLARKVLWESIQHGGNSSWSHDSTCIAPTVEIVCFQDLPTAHFCVQCGQGKP